MKKRIHKRLISFILAIMMWISCTIPTFALEPDDAKDNVIYEKELQNFNNEYQNIYNKIHVYLDKEGYINIDSKDELQEALLYLYEFRERFEFDDSRFWLTVQFRSEFGDTAQYRSYVESKSVRISNDKVDELKHLLYSYSYEYHNSLVKEGLEALSFIEYSEVKFYDYSPFMLLKMEHLNIDELLRMVEMEYIINISINFASKAVETASWNNTMREINAKEIVDEGLYTGRFVNVGIFEAGGICDVEHENLCDKTITLNNNAEVSDHATEVTSIVALMMPDAQYYVSAVEYPSIEWFISKGCNIVNCSFAYLDNYLSNGVYTKGIRAYRYGIDAVFDYQIYYHDITVVASSGNVINNNRSSKYNPDSEVASPGLGFNVITVGGVKRTLNWFEYCLEHDDDACYVSSTPGVKPEVSALYTVTIPNIGIVMGTSYSAPQVTACLTAAIESSTWWLCPEDLKSLLISTANKTLDHTNDIGHFSNKTGAGSVDCHKLIYSYEDYFTEWIDYDDYGNFLFEEYVYLEDGQEIQIGLAWTICLLESGGCYYLNDYDVRIYHISDLSSRLAYSALTNSNSEMIRYTAESTGEYVIIVTQFGTTNPDSEGDYVTLSYCLN